MNLNQDRIRELAEEIIMENHNFTGRIETVEEYLVPFIRKAVILNESFPAEPEDVRRLLTTVADDMPFYVFESMQNKIQKEVLSFIEEKKAGKLTLAMEDMDSLWDFYNNGYARGIAIRQWRLFAEHFRIAKREMSIFTGYPASGKSEFVDELMVQLALQEKWKFAVFSPENYPHAVHFEKLLSKKTGKPFHDGPTNRMSVAEVADGINWIQEHFIMLTPHEENISLDAIFALAKNAIINHTIDLLVIDPWNEIMHTKPKDATETDYIGESLMRCRRFARNNNIALWIVAHPQKPLPPKDGGELPVPGPYNISGSAHWANKADNCLSVYRSRDCVEIHIQKVKFKMRGHMGMVKFSYDKINGQYEEINDSIKQEL